MTTTYCWCSAWYQNHLAIWVKMSFGKLSKMINTLHCPVLQLQFKTWLPFSLPVFCAVLSFFMVTLCFLQWGRSCFWRFLDSKEARFSFLFEKKWRESILYLQNPSVKTVCYLVQTQEGYLHDLCVGSPAQLSHPRVDGLLCSSSKNVFMRLLCICG